jgi:RimJ/RimL family protein N-acetyltransferase
MNPAPLLIRTPRLLLRKPELNDAAAIRDGYAHDPEVTRYLVWKPDQTPGEIRAFLETTLERWEKGAAYAWALTLKEDGRLIGMIDARVDGYMVNVGYVLGRAYWNRGYATEALAAVVGWTDGLEEIHRVWAVCSVDNPASARVMEKAGMTREGILRNWMVFPNIDGSPRDCYCYSRVKF